MDLTKYLEFYQKGPDYTNGKTIIDRSTFELICESDKSFQYLNRYIYENHFDELVDYMDLGDPDLIDYIRYENKTLSFDKSCLISRGDYYLCDGGVKIVESNHNSPGGFNVLNILNYGLDKQYFDPNKDFLNKFVNVWKAFPGVSNLALIGSNSIREVYMMQLFIKELLEPIGINAHIISLNDVTVSGSSMLYGDIKIDAIYSFYPIDRLCTDFQMDKVFDLCKSGNLFLLNYPLNALFEKKSYFSFLWENISMFSVEIQDIIKILIPLSIRLDALISDDLIHIKTSKDDWVLKGIDGYEGNAVYLGIYHSQSHWENILDTYAGSKDFIIQKNINPTIVDGFNVNYGIFDIMNSYAGIFVRLHKSMLASKTDSVMCGIGIC